MTEAATERPRRPARGKNPWFRLPAMPTVTFQGSRTLWNEAFPHDNPWNAAKTSIPEKLKVHPELLLVAIERGTVAGSIMGGYDGHRGWISRAAVLRSYRGRGIGKALVEEVEKRLAALGCIEVNLQVVASNAAVAGFDRSLGYRVEERG